MNNCLRKLSIIFIMCIFILGYFFSYNLGYLSNSKTNIYTESEKKIDIKSSGTYENITINDLPGSWNNWDWAKTQVWCSGSGTSEDPYIIQSQTLTVNGLDDGIIIRNSHSKYFIIENCTFQWEGSSKIGMENAIFLSNTTMGQILKNHINDIPNGIVLSNCENVLTINNTIFSDSPGIYLFQSDFNEVYENIAYNCEVGIFLSNSESNSINNNTVYNNYFGIYLSTSNYNEIIENVAYNNEEAIYSWVSENNTISRNTVYNNTLHGIYLEDGCNNNTISENNIKFNEYGIFLFSASNNNNLLENVVNYNSYRGIQLENGCDENIISKNLLFSNSESGIILVESCEYNNFTENILYNNTNGIYISDGRYNLIYKNFFLIHEKHAKDDGTDNKWNSTTVGNYWDNHTGPDSEPNGIVDDPYIYIGGTADSIDYLPIAEDGAPQITLNSPIEGDIFSIIAPNYSITITDDYLDTMWYTLDGGSNNYTFTENGMVNQSAWDEMNDGTITLTFYARDIPRYIGSAEVNIIKDTAAPVITINSPAEGERFGKNAPLFNITVTDDNLDLIWYSFDGGLTTFAITNNTMLNQTAWTVLTQGDVTITFYASDLAGNEASESVTVIKSVPSGFDPGVIITIVIVSVVGGVAVISVVYIFMKKRVAPA